MGDELRRGQERRSSPALRLGRCRLRLDVMGSAYPNQHTRVGTRHDVGEGFAPVREVEVAVVRPRRLLAPAAASATRRPVGETTRQWAEDARWDASPLPLHSCQELTLAGRAKECGGVALLLRKGSRRAPVRRSRLPRARTHARGYRFGVACGGAAYRSEPHDAYPGKRPSPLTWRLGQGRARMDAAARPRFRARKGRRKHTGWSR